MNEIYRAIPQTEIQRIEKIELLDEQELLRQLFDHYCITVAYKSESQLHLDEISL